MKKYLIVLIILLLVGGYFALGDFFSNSQNEEKNSQGSGEETPSFNYNGWKDYTNSEYGFSLKYPADWDAQEALKPQDETALHEVVFSGKVDNGYRPEFRVYIFTNEQKKDIEEWWSLRLSEEDLKEEKETTLGGLPAHLAKTFQFDSEKECVYSAFENYIYGVCYVGENPNDPMVDEHKDITEKIKESFAFASPVKSNDENKIIGEWKSLDDEKSVKIFEEGGVAKEVYDGEIMAEGTWELTEENVLKFLDADEEYLYTVLKLNDTELELSYLPRGNTLRYIKIED